MARDDDARKRDDAADETTVIAGRQRAWSEVEPEGATDQSFGDESPAALTAGGRDGGPGSAQTQPPGPVLIAEKFGLLTKFGWAFQNIDLTLYPESVAAIVGPAGTGRSSLLLALTGRLAPNTGSLTVAGHALVAGQATKEKPSGVRAVTSVARVGSIATPEPGLTVSESVDERCLLDDVAKSVGRARFAEACDAMRVTFNPTELVGSLVGDQLTLLAVALACVRVSAVIVLDDLDHGVSVAQQHAMVAALLRLARTGPTIVISTTDRVPVMDADVVLDLTPAEGAAMWQLQAAPPPSRLRELGPVYPLGEVDKPELGPGAWSSPPPDSASNQPSPTDEGIDEGARQGAEPAADQSAGQGTATTIDQPSETSTDQSAEQENDHGEDRSGNQASRSADVPTEDPR